MDKYYIVIAGTGETSRANVEALVEDYVYGHGQDVVFILTYDKKPSQGQIFVSQWAKDKSKELLIICNENADYEGLPASSVSHADDPYKEVCTKFKGETVVTFVLPDDEDPDSNRVLGIFAKQKQKMYDLTQGLIEVKFDPKALTAQPEPDMPKVELEVKSEDTDEDVEDEDEFDEDEVESEELTDDILFGMRSLAKLIAKEVVAELMEAQKKPSKGSTE